MKIFLAGRVGPNDWRRQIVRGLDDVRITEATADFPIIEAALEGPIVGFNHDYTGPYFAPCFHGDHGGTCNFTRTAHGAGLASGCHGDGPSRLQLVGMARRAIARSDVVFAWLDDLEAYGTLVEIGFASALQIPIVIGRPFADDYKDQSIFDARDVQPEPDLGALAELWFGLHFADGIIEASSPVSALDGFLTPLPRAKEVHPSVLAHRDRVAREWSERPPRRRR